MNGRSTSTSRASSPIASTTTSIRLPRPRNGWLMLIERWVGSWRLGRRCGRRWNCSGCRSAIGTWSGRWCRSTRSAHRCDWSILDGVVDEDGGDGGCGGEGFGVEGSVAGRGAIQEKRQLFAELFGVGGAGLARGFGEPRGKGFLVVAGA